MTLEFGHEFLDTKLKSQTQKEKLYIGLQQDWEFLLFKWNWEEKANTDLDWEKYVQNTYLKMTYVQNICLKIQ